MKRYMQQITVPEVSIEGQKKIQAAKVLIIGAGGLGTPAALYLSAAGVGIIGILDGDKVELSNLSRQFVYTENEVGELKAPILAAKLLEQNPSIQVNAYTEMLSNENAKNYIGQHDIICDCTDNAETKILIDRVCGQLQKPLIYAVAKGWEGYVTVFHHKRKVTLEHVFSYQSLMENETLNCSGAGIINATCGIGGSIQASEVIKIILGLSSKLDGGILVFNAIEPTFKLFELK